MKTFHFSESLSFQVIDELNEFNQKLGIILPSKMTSTNVAHEVSRYRVVTQ